MNESDIIIRELNEEEIKERKPFSHFGWEGSSAFSFLTISDGYWGSAKLLNLKMIEEKDNFSQVDTLIYPLFFNYRHSIETYLKLLFFKYGEQTDQAKREYLEIGHDLKNLWARLRPFLNKRKKHVGSSVNLDGMEHYIKSLNNFDPDSMMMRYPIEKDLTINKNIEHHFDFINFSKRMDLLCDSLRQLDYDLSNQMLDSSSLKELTDYLDIINKYESHIKTFISILKTNIERKDSRKQIGNDVLSRIFNTEESSIFRFLSECEPDLLILLDNLYYGGRAVLSNEIRLSKSPVARQKEFVKVLNNNLDLEGLRFGKEPEEYQINIWTKSSSAILENISKSLSILKLEE